MQSLSHAVQHHQAGRLAEAEKCYRALLETNPRDGNVLRLLGVLFLQNGQWQQAEEFLKTALNVQPENPEIYNNLGILNARLNKTDDAIAHFKRALALQPDYADALGNLAHALFERGDLPASLAHYQQLAALRPKDPTISIKLGRCYFGLGEFQTALPYFQAVLDRFPNSFEALEGMAACGWALGRLDDALKHLEKASALQPDNLNIITNMGVLHHAQGQLDKALALYNQVLAKAPHFPSAEWQKALTLLALGQYPEGWDLYARSLGQTERGPNRFGPQPPWDGTSAPDKHLLIWGEQGLGDMLQFIRYAELCRQRVGKITVFCPAPLLRLFKAQSFIDDAVDSIADRDSFDEHVPMMNLPHLFGTVLESVPTKIPYLTVPPDLTEKWKAKIPDDNRFKVGLVWAGGNHKGNARGRWTDMRRSLNLAQIKPWLKIPGIRFFSLQHDEAKKQIAEAGLQLSLTDLMDEVTDFADTAAIIENLDLVITVDTSVAHLAGALGKPVWILSRRNADWRWLQNRADSPWYPTVRIFGQSTADNWDDVIVKIGAELRHFVSSPKP